MYSRYDPPGERIRIPDHYGGSAFSGKKLYLPQREEEPVRAEVARPTPPPPPLREHTDTPPAPVLPPDRHPSLPSFPFGHGIGFEELFLMGLILLISQSDGNGDMVLCLALLLLWG